MCVISLKRKLGCTVVSDFACVRNLFNWTYLFKYWYRLKWCQTALLSSLYSIDPLLNRKNAGEKKGVHFSWDVKMGLTCICLSTLGIGLQLSF